MAELKATKRTELGTHRVRRLRRTGSVPGIIYGHGEQPVAVALSRHDVELAVRHGERVLQVDLEGRTENVLIKDVQWDTFAQELAHVDLYRVSLDERVEVTVPIVLRGTPAGAADGGVLQQLISDVGIECVVTAIPEELRLSVVAMKVGDAMRLKDLKLPEGAVLQGDGEAIVCSVTLVAEEVAAPAAEGEAAAEPEVIGREAKEEAEGAEEGGRRRPAAERGEKSAE